MGQGETSSKGSSGEALLSLTRLSHLELIFLHLALHTEATEVSGRGKLGLAEERRKEGKGKGQQNSWQCAQD